MQMRFSFFRSGFLKNFAVGRFPFLQNQKVHGGGGREAVFQSGQGPQIDH
jgi:hypothetical protein